MAPDTNTKIPPDFNDVQYVALTESLRIARVENEELRSHLADCAVYIRRMSAYLEGHASRIQLRARDFVNRKLKKFERGQGQPEEKGGVVG